MYHLSQKIRIRVYSEKEKSLRENFAFFVKFRFNLFRKKGKYSSNTYGFTKTFLRNANENVCIYSRNVLFGANPNLDPKHCYALSLCFIKCELERVILQTGRINFLRKKCNVSCEFGISAMVMATV